MPSTDVAKIDQKSLFGFQPGLGTAATADKQFPDISVVPAGMSAVRAIYAVGEEFAGAVQHGIVESDLAVTGDVIDFVGVCYALEGMFGTVTPTTVGGTGKKRIYTPGSTLPRFFTNDFGNSVRFRRAVDCFLHSLHFHATLNETVFDGAGKAQLIKDSVQAGLTLAGSPTLIAQKTPDPLNSDLYFATTLAGLDSAVAYGRGFVFDLNVTDRWGTIHAMNSSLAGSFDGIKRQRPGTASGMIQVGAGDNDGWDWLTRCLANTIAYIRYRVFGDIIQAGTAEIQGLAITATGGTYSLTILGRTITLIPYNTNGAALQALVRSLPVRGAADVAVTGASSPYTFTFPSYLGNVAQITVDGTGLTGGTATPSTTTPGVDPVTYLFQVDAAVATSEFPKSSDMEGLDALDIPMFLMKTASLNGFQVTVVNELATL